MQASEGFSCNLPQSISQASQQRQSNRQARIELSSLALGNSLRAAVAFTSFSLGIAAILAFQQLLIQIYFTCWPMALLFALIGLMVALLVGQFYSDRRRTQPLNWSLLSSMSVTLFGLGVVLCIMSTTPGLA
ncbi:MAG: hypothetical protein IGS54_30585 [Elainella sp. C42_A2020_010]|nr:hypothetical protein [Elainella sp. C42_A2020_010]